MQIAKTLAMSPNRATAVVAAIVGSCTLATAISLGLSSAGVLMPIASAVGVIVVSLSVPLARLLQRRFDLFEPIIGGCLVLLILFGIRPLYLIASGESTYLGYSIRDQLGNAINLGLLGTIAFVLGYLGAVGRRPGEHDQAAGHVEDEVAEYGPNDVSTWLALGISALGLLLFALHLLRVGPPSEALALWLAGRSNNLVEAYTGTSEYLSAGPILLVCAGTTLGVLRRWRLTPWQFVGIISLIAIPVIVFAVGGDRRFLIPTIAVPITSYYLTRQRRPTRNVLLILGPLLFVFLATIPFSRAAGAREQAGGALPIFAEAFAAPFTAWDRFITSYDTEMIGALSVQLSVQNTPDAFYYGRATIGDVLIAPIPSSLFPDKPMTARNDLLIRAFGSPCTLTDGGLCPDFSVIGTFYQDLWWLGALVGMALLGVVTGLVWRRYNQKSGSPYRIILAATWVVALPILIRAGFMPSFAWWLYFLLPTLALTAMSVVTKRLR